MHMGFAQVLSAHVFGRFSSFERKFYKSQILDLNGARPFWIRTLSPDHSIENHVNYGLGVAPCFVSRGFIGLGHLS